MIPHSGLLKVTTKGEREIVMTRVFDAPRQLLFDALTKPDLVRRWLLGPDGWTMPVCEIDLRVGGAYRYVWEKAGSGERMGMRGVYKDIAIPARIVSTERFDEPWYPGDALGMIVLTENNGKTKLVQTVAYQSAAARAMVLKTPMADGVSAGYDRLAALLAEMAKGGADKKR
ncbi:MAG: SRPBCC family protein [Bauldia sp.]